jgi:hypothetical protein
MKKRASREREEYEGVIGLEWVVVEGVMWMVLGVDVPEMGLLGVVPYRP